MVKNNTSLKGEIVSMLLIGSLVAVTAGMALLSSVVVKNRQTVQTKAADRSSVPKCEAGGSINVPCTVCNDFKCTWRQDLDAVEGTSATQQCCDVTENTKGDKFGSYIACLDNSDCAADKTMESSDYANFISCDEITEEGCKYCGAPAAGFFYNLQNFTWYENNIFHGNACKEYCKKGNYTLNDLPGSLCPIKSTINVSPIPTGKKCEDFDGYKDECNKYSCRYIDKIWSDLVQNRVTCGRCVNADDNSSDETICNDIIYPNQLYCKGEYGVLGGPSGHEPQNNEWKDCNYCKNGDSELKKLADSTGCKNYCLQVLDIYQKDGSCGKISGNWGGDTSCDKCERYLNKHYPSEVLETNPVSYERNFCAGTQNNPVGPNTASGKQKYSWDNCNLCGQNGANFADKSHCEAYCREKCAMVGNAWSCDTGAAYCSNYLDTIPKPTPEPKEVYKYICTNPSVITLNNRCKRVQFGYAIKDNGFVSEKRNYDVWNDDILGKEDCEKFCVYGNRIRPVTNISTQLVCSEQNNTNCDQCGWAALWEDNTYCSAWVWRDGHKVAYPQNVPPYRPPAPTAKPTPIEAPKGFINIPGVQQIGPVFKCEIGDFQVIDNKAPRSKGFCEANGKTVDNCKTGRSISDCGFATCKYFNYSFVTSCTEG